MREILKKIRDYLFFLVRDKKYFYENKVASFSFGWLLYANLIKPGRTHRRLINNKSKRFSLFYFIRKQARSELSTNVIFDRARPEESLLEADMALREHGAVVIENYFLPDVIERFEDTYQKYIEAMKSQESRFGDPLPLTKDLLNLWLDPALYGLMKKYYGTTPYCRSYPLLQYVDKNSTIEFKESKKGIAYPWHIDHCPIFAQMVYLSDVKQEGTCMEIVSGSHRYPNVGLGLYSDEYIDNCGLPLLKLSGPKGSVQMHDPNVVHRARPVQGTDRLWLFSDFSWGENILFDISTAAGMLANATEPLSTLTAVQREVMSGIFPQTPFKGYCMENGYLSPQIFREI